MRKTMALIALTTAALGSTAASAETLDLSLGYAHRWVTSDSMNAIADHDSLSSGVMGAGWSVGELSGIRLVAEARFEVGGVYSDTFQRIDTELSVQRFAVGGRGELPLRRWVRAFARATVGPEWATLRLQDSGSTADPISDRAWSASGALSGGLDVTLLRSPNGFVISCRLEAGYKAQSSLSFIARPEGTGDDELEISTATAQLGDLQLSGIESGMSLALQF